MYGFGTQQLRQQSIQQQKICTNLYKTINVVNICKLFYLPLHCQYQRIVVSYNNMFNPKERLEQIRKNKSTREEVNTFIADTPSPPLFSEQKPNNDSQDLISRISKLENIVNELSNQLDSSKTVITSLRKENNDLENKLLKLEYENSQLKIVSSKVIEKQSSRIQISHSDRSSAQKEDREVKEVKKSESNITENEVLMVEVEQALQQIKKEPIQNILKRKEHNFRALKTDPRQTNHGNKVLKEFATICKDYHKTLKKPLLVLKLQASDFE